jgi:hypothetical protein
LARETWGVFVLVLNFLWLALGIGALLVAGCLCLVLLRSIRTLAVIEEAFMTADDTMRQLAPDAKGTLNNVNDVTAAVNIGLRAAGTGTARLGEDLAVRSARSRRGLAATWHGLKVGTKSLLSSVSEPEPVRVKRVSGGKSDG